MIAHIRGELAAALSDSVIVDVGGVGYHCMVSATTRAQLPPVGQEVLLHTSLQMRQDSVTLYGFLSREEFDLFELLLRVDGIGPRVAMGILSATTAKNLRRCIAFEDIPGLCRLPGVGKKTAQRLLLELKDKVGALGETSGDQGIPTPPRSEAGHEALEALVTLGYSRTESMQALERARRDAGEDPNPETLVRLSLKHLYRG